jgi:hypothetical protein
VRRSAALIFVTCGIALASIGAQAQDWLGLLNFYEPYVLALGINEPFPWGTLPSPSGKASMYGQVSGAAMADQEYTWAFGERRAGDESKRSFRGGSGETDWAVDGTTLGWSAGERRYVWNRWGDPKRLTEWAGKWESPKYIKLYAEGKADPVETWSPREGKPGYWVKRGPDGDEEHTIEAVYTKALSLKYLNVAFGSSVWRGDFSTDDQGRVSETRMIEDGKETERYTIARDAQGNITKLSRSVPLTAFGETVLQLASVSTRTTAYRKQGGVLAPLSEPPELAAWLQPKGDESPETSAEQDAEPVAEPDAEQVAEAEGSKDPGAWRSSVETDALTDLPKYFASLVAASSTKSNSWAAQPTLCVRNQDGEPEVYVTFGEYLKDEGQIALRFDTDAPLYLGRSYWSRSTDMTSVFISGVDVDGRRGSVIDLVDLLRSRKKLLVQASKYDGTKVEAVFDLAGLGAAIEQVVPVATFLGAGGR